MASHSAFDPAPRLSDGSDHDHNPALVPVDDLPPLGTPPLRPVSMAASVADDRSIARSITVEFRTMSVQLQEGIDLGDADTEVDFHKLDLHELATLFGTSTATGLEAPAAAKRLDRDGRNLITPPKSNYFLKLLGYCIGGFGLLLWFGAIICIIAWRPLGSPPDPTNLGLGALLFIVMILQTAFNAYQDWTSAQVMKSINNMLPASCDVIRDGILKTIPASELVTGDRVQLNYGNKVPADVRIIECVDLKFDKSVLTGENDPIKATVEYTSENYLETRNMGLMGTLVTNGNGVGIVVATGDSTVMGKISKLTTGTKKTRSTLQVEITRFVTLIASLAFSTAAILLIVWGTWLRRSFPTFINTSTALINTIAVLVAFVPVGLPIAVTLALTLVARKMASQKVLVKDLMTVETLGSVNVIASDKTGTLTQNRMFVSNALAGGDRWSLSEDVARRLDDFAPAFQQLVASARLCNGATFDPFTLHLPLNDRTIAGDATDSAMLRFSATLAPHDQQVADAFQVLRTIPFNSKNKWMMSVVRSRNSRLSTGLAGALAAGVEESEFTAANDDGNHHLAPPVANYDSPATLAPMVGPEAGLFGTSRPVMLIKGAPDILVPKAKWYLNTDGSMRPFDDQLRATLIEQQERWSADGQRVLMVCKRVLKSAAELPADGDDLEALAGLAHSLCVVGLVGIMDPPRPEIRDVVATCHRAGMRVLMVTGDFALTAAAIAKQVGIFTSDQIDTIESLRTLTVDSHVRNSEYDDDEDGTGQKSLDDDCVVPYRTTTVPPSAAFRVGSPPVTASFSEKRTYNQPRVSTGSARSKDHLDCFTGSLLLSGGELNSLTPAQWTQVTQYREIVFARTTPEQKLQIVQQFQLNGGIVAVTGDGVNDAPALKNANLGIAMGGGSDVAIEAAHMVLLDNNFSSVLVAIENGRLVFDNLKKCILYLLPAGSFAECIPILVNMFLGVPLPLSAFLMICICVLTDLPPSIALMYEGPERDLLARAPRVPHKDRLVNAKLLLHAYGFAGMLETVFGHVMFFYYMAAYGGLTPGDLFLAFDKWEDGYKGYTLTELNDFMYTGQTIMFISLVMCQCFGNLLSIRTRYLSLFQHFPIPSPWRWWSRPSAMAEGQSLGLHNHADLKSNEVVGPTTTPTKRFSYQDDADGRNLVILVSWACSIGFALFIVYVPFVNNVFNTRPIPAQFFFIPIAYAFGMLGLDELRKLAVRRNYGIFPRIAW